MSSSFSHSNFTVSRKGHKLIIRSLLDVQKVSEMDDFLSSYSKMVMGHNPSQTKMLVLFDIRAWKISLYKPKLDILSKFTQFFSKLTPHSVKAVRAVAILLDCAEVSSVIKKTLKMFPDQIPTTVSNDLEECKKFLAKY